MSALSAPGSRVAADHLPADSPSIGSLIAEVAQTWRNNGYDVRFGSLTYPHGRSDAESALRNRGWLVNRHTITDLLVAAKISTHGLDTSPSRHGAIHYLSAVVALTTSPVSGQPLKDGR
jgi:hypothetical protein